MGRVFYNWNEALQTKNILHGHAEESGTMAEITITKVFCIKTIYPIFWSASFYYWFSVIQIFEDAKSWCEDEIIQQLR